MPITQYTDGGGVTPTITRRVYYTGTDTLLEGYALCYNFDAADQSAEGWTTGGDGTTISLADSLVPTAARRIQVEKPTWKNSNNFAGVVSEKSDSVTGPAWIEINLPGSICNIYAYADCDHEDDYASALNSGQMLTFTCEQYYFRFSGFPGAGSATVLGDVDRSTTAGKVQAELMTGAQSGGVQVIESVHMVDAGSATAGGSIYISPVGWTTNVRSQDASYTAAASTLGFGTALGGRLPVGALKGIRNTNSASAAISPFSIVGSLMGRQVGSVAPDALQGVSGTFTTNSELYSGGIFRWDGGRWNIIGLLNSLSLYTT